MDFFPCSRLECGPCRRQVFSCSRLECGPCRRCLFSSCSRLECGPCRRRVFSLQLNQVWSLQAMGFFLQPTRMLSLHAMVFSCSQVECGPCRRCFFPAAESRTKCEWSCMAVDSLAEERTELPGIAPCCGTIAKAAEGATPEMSERLSVLICFLHFFQIYVVTQFIR